ncbi:hypothetical protein EI427_21640 [Flammeovirga pectinis]|uniref:Uncharacterized protein n=1 Tax=Flammeovirga pectinis TaxID=2494373 RepID=A0A3Q9FUQ5_9BACT|nr:hypothetical protein [Flammeovirga pectinis]AZQ64831.1 hypothetical protein EI427_21640 [Flammeovirga pectinis]
MKHLLYISLLLIQGVVNILTVGISHDFDPLSGVDIGGVFNLETNNGFHSNDGFIQELGSFIQSYLGPNITITQATIDDFVQKMRNNFNIDVEVTE